MNLDDSPTQTYRYTLMPAWDIAEWVGVPRALASIAEACELLEHNSPNSNNWMNIYCELAGQQTSIGVCFDIRLVTIFQFSDRFFDVDMWMRFGRAVRNSNLLKLQNVNDGDLVASAERCIRAFFAAVKHNKSIVE
jgi:hypothetical protein